MTAPTMRDYDLLLAVRDHAPGAIEAAEAEAQEHETRAEAARRKAAQLRALLEAAKEVA